MKRYASNYLLIPTIGFIKNHVIKVNEHRIAGIFPLAKESEATVWEEGLLILIPSDDFDWLNDERIINLISSLKENIFNELPANTFNNVLATHLQWRLVAYYPFNNFDRIPVKGASFKILL